MKRAVSVLLSFVLVFCMAFTGGISASAYYLGDEYQLHSGDYIYTITDFSSTPYTATITGYTGLGGNITIPDWLGTLEVAGIGYNAFANNSHLTSVVIPNSVKSIDGNAFLGCWGLTHVTIPASVTSIAGSAFLECNQITQFSVDPANPMFSSEGGVLYNKDKSTLIAFPAGPTGSYTIPTSVKSIGANALAYSWGMTDITIPSTVTSIGEGAFENCVGLTNVTIPDSVTSLGYGAFRFCWNLKSVTIGNGLATIDVDTFYDCHSLKSVSLSTGLIKIGYNAFASCSALTDITLPDGLAFIENQAFGNCTSLTSITIPASVNYFIFPFWGCTSLASATFLGNAPEIFSYSMFFGCAPNFKLYYVMGKTGFSNPWVEYDTQWITDEGNLLTNGEFETDIGFNQGIENCFPSPYSADPAWSTADDFHRWFSASAPNETVNSKIISAIQNPENPNCNNKIASVAETALHGVTIVPNKTYELTFAARVEMASQSLNVSFVDASNANTDNVHPILYPVTEATGTNISGQTTQPLSPVNIADSSISLSSDDDGWVTYHLQVTVGEGDELKPCAIQFYSTCYGSTDYRQFYLDNVSLREYPETLTSLDADCSPNEIVGSGDTGTIGYAEAPEAGAPTELGSSVYRITNYYNQSAWANAPLYLKAGKQYDVSFWFKVAEDHPMFTTEESNKYISFFLNKATSYSTTISTEGDALLSSLTVESADGEKVVTHPTDTGGFKLNDTKLKNADGNAVWKKITASFTPTEDTPAYFGFNTNADSGSVYIDQIKVTSAENESADVQAVMNSVGCAIRTSGTQALRFKTSIDKSALENQYFGDYELVEYGSVAIKTAYLGGKELVDGAYGDKHTVKGASYIKGVKNSFFADTGTKIHFTAALIGISETNYNSSYSVRAYAVLARPDGSTFTVYDDETRSATIYSIANAAYNAPGSNNGFAESPAIRNYLNANIISKANFTTYPGDGFKPVG